jgi:hypothetical protein
LVLYLLGGMAALARPRVAAALFLAAAVLAVGFGLATWLRELAAWGGPAAVCAALALLGDRPRRPPRVVGRGRPFARWSSARRRDAGGHHAAGD